MKNNIICIIIYFFLIYENSLFGQTYYNQQQHYHNQQIAVPIALPVVVPNFSYQYVPPACNQHTQNTMFPQVGQNQQFNQSFILPKNTKNTQQFQSDDETLKLLAKLLAKQLMDELNNQPNNFGQTNNINDDNGPPVAIFKIDNKLNENDNIKNSSRPNPQSGIAQLAINALHRSCAACHTGTASKGDAIIFVQNNVLNNDFPYKSIISEIESNRMPPKNSNYRLTDEEKNIIISWLTNK